MFAILLLGWWYGRGWAWAIKRSIGWLSSIDEIFSVGILLKTLFAPWKQIQSEKTFQNFIQSTLDNSISRLIGASVRIMMLFCALVLGVVVLAVVLTAIIIWPFIPAMIVILPILSLRLVGA